MMHRVSGISWKQIRRSSSTERLFLAAWRRFGDRMALDVAYWRGLRPSCPSTGGEQNPSCGGRRGGRWTVVLGCERLLLHLALPHGGAPFPFAVPRRCPPLVGEENPARDRRHRGRWTVVWLRKSPDPLALRFWSAFPFAGCHPFAGEQQILPLRRSLCERWPVENDNGVGCFASE
jgi:hypothetical protein